MAEKKLTPLPGWTTDLYESVKDQWHKDNRNYLPLHILEIMQTTLKLLQCQLEDWTSGTTWTKPYIIHKYEVDWDWSNNKRHQGHWELTLTSKDLAHPEQLKQKILSHLDTRTIYAFIHHFSEEIDFLLGIDSLSEQERDYITNKFFFQKKITQDGVVGLLPISHVGLKSCFFLKHRSEERPIGTLFLRFYPLVINRKTRHAFYPVQTGIVFFSELVGNAHPSQWRLTERRAFWRQIFTLIHELFSDLSSGESGTKYPGLEEQIVRAVNKSIAPSLSAIAGLTDLMQLKQVQNRTKKQKTNRIPDKREEAILEAIHMGLEGFDYCEFLDRCGTKPLGSWEREDWPGAYTKAYNYPNVVKRKQWQKKIWDDKYKVMNRFQKIRNSLITRRGE
jgi:hypothetical protein